ncbi:MAG: nucleotidyl transferase AbiEii/AbiGii toxin family protein [Synergistaceae bacterium]|jgi:predicted nucleotidyltransferase component of viral defense system|nr:nucleotidyl transferase AbiEii/AbiGii toxin family protein [Synergistaceae bacterium]
MAKSLLTEDQKLFLDFACGRSEIYRSFYFSGGTALSEFYLHHRLSEDLDFFSSEPVDTAGLDFFLRANKEFFGNPVIHFHQSFNRNLFFLQFKDVVRLKCEFTYYPFTRLETGSKLKSLEVDSVLDIAVNKVFTMSQQARGRDYFDLYEINRKYGFEIPLLAKLARSKFDSPINYLQLGKNLTKVDEFLDDPVLTETPSSKEMKEFFLRTAMQLEIL